MNEVTTSTSEAAARISAGKLVFGVVLFGVGVLAFVDAVDLWETRELRRYWPLILIAIGLSNELDTLRTRRGDGGYIMIAIGVWMLAATQDFLGLDYISAFPLGVAVAGLGIILHALLGIEAKEKKEQQS